MAHRRRGREEWRRICAASEATKLAPGKFAAAVGVHPRTLVWWRAEFRREERRSAAVMGGGFVEVVDSAGRSGERVVVRVGDVAVELGTLPPAAWLAELASRC